MFKATSLGNATPDRIETDGLFYLNTVLADLQTLPGSGEGMPSPELRDMTDRIRANKTEATWADLFALEIAVARHEPKERLLRRICLLREKYRLLFGETAYGNYLKCSSRNLAEADINELRAEAETLLGEFHWYYSASRARELLFHETRRYLLYWFVGMLVIGALFNVLVDPTAYIQWLSSGWEWIKNFAGMKAAQGGAAAQTVAAAGSSAASTFPTPTFLVVIYAGMLGAFSSIMRRLQLAQAQRLSPVEDPVVRLSELGLGKMTVTLALASGAVFSMVIFMVFTGKMIDGLLFPSICTPLEPVASTGLGFNGFAKNTGPCTGAEWAKLLVWAFASGFAERFVPDVIDRLSSKATPPAAAPIA